MRAKTVCRIAGFAALVAVFVFSFAACDGSEPLAGGKTDGGKDGGGTITITDIPAEYDGKYAMFEGKYNSSGGHTKLVGAQSIDDLTQAVTLVPVSNGKVSLPGWMAPDDYSASFAKYSGSDDVEGAIVILDSATIEADDEIQPVFMIIFGSIQFSNGSAAKSCNDAKDNSLIPGGGEGTLTVTDIPAEYNKKYAFFEGFRLTLSGGITFLQLKGVQSYNASTKVTALPVISDGKVSLPVWIKAGNGYVGYSGSDDVEGTIVIFTTVNGSGKPKVVMKFDPIQFSKGAASISWSEGTEYILQR